MFGSPLMDVLGMICLTSKLRLKQRILASTVSVQTRVLSYPAIPAMLQVQVSSFFNTYLLHIYFYNGFLFTVTMQALKEAPLDMQCKDKFLVQSVIVSDGTTSKEVLAEMVALYLSLYFFFFFILLGLCLTLIASALQFNKEAGRVIEDLKLRVVYIPANPPSPVPEGSEEGNSPRTSVNDIASSQTASLFDYVRSLSIYIYICLWNYLATHRNS